jgi:hypothetical protein
MRTNPVRFTARYLGAYAALLALEHGIFQLLQGGSRGSSFIIQAIGPPCQPDLVWHACLPALTVLPDLWLSGLVTFIVSLGLLLVAIFWKRIRSLGLVMGGLSLLLLPAGGGFVPVWFGLSASIVGHLSLTDPPLTWLKQSRITHLLGRSWYWVMGLLAVWFPASWLLGAQFPEVMLELGSFLFVFIDVLLPVYLALSSLAYTTVAQQE